MLLFSPTPYPSLLLDSNFSATLPLNIQTNLPVDIINSSQANQGWYASGAERREESVEFITATQDSIKPIGLQQIIADYAERRGNQRLSLDLRNIEGDTSANQIRVAVWGINGEFQAGLAGQPTAVGALPMNSTQLLEEFFGGESHDWTTYGWDVDFGEGYQFILVQINADNFSPINGDQIAVDNVFIGDAHHPITLNDSLLLIDQPSGTVDVLSNDVDLEGESLHLIDFSQGNYGSVAENIDGTLTYTPNPGYFGRDQVIYTISDSDGAISQGLLDITVDRISREGLVLELDLDEETGRSISNLAVEDRLNILPFYGNLSVNNQGIQDKARYFDGENSFIALEGNRLNYLKSEQDKYTISLWFRADDININERKQILFEQGSGSEGLSIYLFDGKLYAGGINTSTGWTGTWLNTDQVESGRLHHVTLVLDANNSIEENRLIAYLDGEEIGRGTATQVNPTLHSGALGNDFEFVAFHDQSYAGTGTQNGFKGHIDAVRIYERVLSSPEIQLIAQQQGINISDIDFIEGAVGTQEAVFTVTLDQATDETVTVNYSTIDNTAIAGEDYLGISGTLTFNPGQTSQNINVTILSDIVAEDNESFWLYLSNAENSVLTDSYGQVTIINDDISELSINDINIAEGDHSNNANATFTVFLSTPSSQIITVDYSTISGTATAGDDYIAVDGTLTFTPGQTSQTISVPIWGDGLVENNETFQVILSNPENAIVTDVEGNGTLIDDDSTGQAFSEVNFDDGIIVFEAEAFHAQVARSEYSWEIITEVEASAGQALQVWPDTGRVWGNGDFAALNSPRLDYRIDFSEIGTYYVWVLGRAGGSTVNTSDRAYVGLDGNLASAALLPTVTEDYGWKKVALEVDSVGQHTLNLWMNKDGFIADKILLTQNADLNLVNDRLSTISIHDVTQIRKR